MQYRGSCFARLARCMALVVACAGWLQAQDPRFGDLDGDTQKVLALFHEIARIPRCSGKEGSVGNWLQAWGKANGFLVDGDRAGNVFIRVPATPGLEGTPGIILQTHMDMVCEKAADSLHDFSKDPITLVRDGAWLKADRTSLGADDGIGMALALSIAQDPGCPHPPLELLFTTGEETSGRGVAVLEKRNIDGKVLINLDSEQEGTLVIGDASSTGITLTANLESEAIPENCAVYSLRVTGLQGGHSGVDINTRRANAIKIFARALEALQGVTETRLVSVKGGTASNAIPRSVEAQVALVSGAGEPVLKTLQELQAAVLKECGTEDPGIAILLQPAEPPWPKAAFLKDETLRLVSLLRSLPNGVASMDARFPGVPEASSSLGIIQSGEGKVIIQSMQRSSQVARLVELNQRVAGAATAAGAFVRSGTPGDPWLTSPDAEVVRACKAAYVRVFGQTPVVSIVHGGLECGGISRKGGGLDTVSMGPTIQNPHSPGERVFIPSLKRVRDLLIAVLGDYR